jgi:hypothetical protein
VDCERHPLLWIPSPNGVAWILVWRLGVGSGMPGLQQCSCKGSGPSGVHGLGGLMESLEACGGVLDTPCVATLHLEPLLCTTSPWSLTCVPLECSTPLV